VRNLAKRRIQIAERLFDSYQFGNWNLEEVSHWHVARAGEELCRSIMLCGTELGVPCLRGEFIVRFKTGSVLVLERYATAEGCLIGGRIKAAIRTRARNRSRI
jgi:hypothetical protein